MRRHSRFEHPFFLGFRYQEKSKEVLRSQQDSFRQNDPFSDGGGNVSNDDPFGQGSSQFGEIPEQNNGEARNTHTAYTNRTNPASREAASTPGRPLDQNARLWQGMPNPPSTSTSSPSTRLPAGGGPAANPAVNVSYRVSLSEGPVAEKLVKTLSQFLGTVISHTNPLMTRGPDGVADRGLQGLFRTVGFSNLTGLSSQLHLMGLQNGIRNAPSPEKAFPPLPSASSASPEAVVKGARSTVSEALPERLLNTLGAFFNSPVVSQALKQVLSQSVSKWLGLPLEDVLQKLSLNDFSGKLAEPWHALLAPTLEKGVLGPPPLMGIAVSEFPGMKNLLQLFNPFLRIFFGGVFLKGSEVDLKNFRSVLLDEIGALMARRTRRHRRRDKKRISRADRVMAKDQSLPIDTQSQEEDDEAFFEIESWLKSQTPQDVTSFLWN